MGFNWKIHKYIKKRIFGSKQTNVSFETILYEKKKKKTRKPILNQHFQKKIRNELKGQKCKRTTNDKL